MMKKIMPYKIFHLEHDQLRYLQDKKNFDALTDEEKKAVETYLSLLSNLPRQDISLRNEFIKSFDDYDDYVDDLAVDSEQLNKEKNHRKVKSAKKLFEMGFYAHVADVDAPCAKDAVDMTMHLNRQWTLDKNKSVVVHDCAWRSTSSYDIVQRFDEFFLKMPLGFLELAGGEYAKKLV